jgi:hypothetical protein
MRIIFSALFSLFLTFQANAGALQEGMKLLNLGKKLEAFEVLETGFTDEKLDKLTKAKIAYLMSFAHPPKGSKTQTEPSYYALYSLKYYPQMKGAEKNKLYRLLGDYYFSIADFSNSITYYLKVINNTENADKILNEYATYKLGWVYVNQGNYDLLESSWTDYLSGKTPLVSLTEQFYRDYGKFFVENLTNKKSFLNYQFIMNQEDKLLKKYFLLGIQDGFRREKHKGKMKLVNKLSPIQHPEILSSLFDTKEIFRKNTCDFIRWSQKNTIERLDVESTISHIHDCEKSKRKKDKKYKKFIKTAYKKLNLSGQNRIYLANYQYKQRKFKSACREYKKSFQLESLRDNPKISTMFVNGLQASCQKDKDLSSIATVLLQSDLLEQDDMAPQLISLLLNPQVKTNSMNNEKFVKIAIAHPQVVLDSIIKNSDKENYLVNIHPLIKNINFDKDNKRFEKILRKHIAYFFELGKSTYSKKVFQIYSKRLTKESLSYLSMYQGSDKNSKVTVTKKICQSLDGDELSWAIQKMIKQNQYREIINNWKCFKPALTAKTSQLESFSSALIIQQNIDIKKIDNGKLTHFVHQGRNIISGKNSHFGNKIPKSLKKTSLYKDLTLLQSLVSTKKKLSKIRKKSFNKVFPIYFKKLRSLSKRIQKSKWFAEDYLGKSVLELNKSCEILGQKAGFLKSDKKYAAAYKATLKAINGLRIKI